MGKVLDIAAYGDSSVAIGYDRIIYVWGDFHYVCRTIPFSTKFSKIHEVSAHSQRTSILKPLIVLTNNFNYVEEALNILEALRAIFDDPVRFIIILYAFFLFYSIKLYVIHIFILIWLL